MCAVSLLMPNSSAINIRVSRRSCASICRTFSIISGVLLVDGSSTVVFVSFAKVFELFVNTFSAHGFPPVHMHQHFTRFRCSFLPFVAELQVCTLLHCAVALPLILTTFNRPQSVYTADHMQSMLCVDSPHVSEEPCACAHTYAKLPFRYDIIHRTF